MGIGILKDEREAMTMHLEDNFSLFVIPLGIDTSVGVTRMPEYMLQVDESHAYALSPTGIS